MKSFAFLFVALIFFSACNSSNSERSTAEEPTTTVEEETPETEFSEEGISFSYPEDWFVSDFENNDSNSYYVSVEKRGENESGLVSISWAPSSSQPDFMQEYLNGLRASSSDIEDLQISDAYQSDFDSLNATMRDYSMVVMGIEHVGRLVELQNNGLSVLILEQEALEDSTRNKPGMQMIENTLQIN